METFQHPDGKIILLNGSVIDAIEKETENLVPPFSGMQLDTTGEYLQMVDANRRHKAKRSESDDKTIQLRSLFNKNALFLYSNKDAIYADSRMFLAPLDVGCHLAYTGRSGFTGATLGVWLELWDALEIGRCDESGHRRLITYFAGSPLSGANSCSGVIESGEMVKFSIREFHTLFRTFMKINSRYYGLSGKYESFSLRETINRLSCH